MSIVRIRVSIRARVRFYGFRVQLLLLLFLYCLDAHGSSYCLTESRPTNLHESAP